MTRRISSGAAPRVLTLRLGSRFSHRLALRPLLLDCCLMLACAGATIIALGLGEYRLGPSEVMTGLLHDDGSMTHEIVTRWRLPMAVGALVCGALLGVAGSIFQTMTRNPLGSPDVIGFDAGAYSGVVVCILLAGSHEHWLISLSALAGGVITALLVWVLSARAGSQGTRLILVGIGVSATLGAVNACLVTRADVHDSMSVAFWGAGSLDRIEWAGLVPCLAGAVLVVGVLVALAPALRQIDLVPDAAPTQGVPLSAVRAVLLFTGVGATALVTATAGPIGFVALCAPQLVRRILRDASTPMLTAALMGASLLSLAHTASLALAEHRHVVPEGLITVGLGGCYFIVILIRQARNSS